MKRWLLEDDFLTASLAGQAYNSVITGNTAADGVISAGGQISIGDGTQVLDNTATSDGKAAINLADGQTLYIGSGAILSGNTSNGGFNSAVLESLETGDVKTPVEAIAWPDQFIEHGSESILRKKYGLTAEAALQKIIPHLNS